MTSPVRRALLAAFLAAASISGCRCGPQAPAEETVHHPQACDTAADCCPGQACKAEAHYCFDKYLACAQDGSCPAQGEVCREIGVFPKGMGCTFEKCDPSGACGAGKTCFNKFCVGEAPCNGGCGNPSAPVCVTATNLCSPAPKDTSCAQTCPAGKMLVLQDPSNIFDTCSAGAEKCECTSLPPLPVRDVSRHSSIATDGRNLYVSAYDGQPYGDLVVHTFDKTNLSKPVKTQWLDGVPATGHVGGDVDGPRNGITDPGPDVGQYTSIAATPAGDLYVAYYDVDNGDLKFTARYGGQWIPPITVDGSNGDVGMYASLALDSSGIPAVAYFRRGSHDPATGAETGPSTALVYAVAKIAQPRTPADWVVVGDVDRADRPPAQGLSELPGGVGLMPSLAFLGRQPVIAYYENLAKPDGTPLRALKAVMGSGSGVTPGFGAPVEIDGNDPAPPSRDTGRWPSLAVRPGRIAIAFADLTAQQLLLYQSDTLIAHASHAGPIHVVDDGKPEPGDAWHPQGIPGAQTSIAFTPNGKIAMAYQDATAVDLVFTLWDPLSNAPVAISCGNATRKHCRLRSAGASGFWPRMALIGGTAYISSATIKAVTASMPANRLFVDATPAP